MKFGDNISKMVNIAVERKLVASSCKAIRENLSKILNVHIL